LARCNGAISGQAPLVRPLHCAGAMPRGSGEQRLLQSARHLRLVLKSREPNDIATCEHLTFAFARDAGLRGVDVWFAGACAAMLATHLAARGGGELELRVADWPRPALELIATDDGVALDGFSEALIAARDCASELRVAWHVSAGSIVTARFWLRPPA